MHFSPYTNYDSMNWDSQLHFMLEYAGWHIGNSKVGFKLPFTKRSVEGTTFDRFGAVLGLSSRCLAVSEFSDYIRDKLIVTLLCYCIIYR